MIELLLVVPPDATRLKIYSKTWNEKACKALLPLNSLHSISIPEYTTHSGCSCAVGQSFPSVLQPNEKLSIVYHACIIAGSGSTDELLNIDLQRSEWRITASVPDTNFHIHIL